MIVAKGVSRRFGDVEAVRDLTITLGAGEVLALLGPNGAGKSTTLRILAGVVRQSAGRVEVCGHDMTRSRRRAQACIGYLPEGAPSYADMTAAEVLEFGASAHGLRGRDARRAVGRVLDLVDAGAVAGRMMATLSKGFRRRIGLAFALLPDPPVLLLDEPTDGLDPLQADRVHALIKSLGESRCVLVSTHALDEVEEIATRVAVLSDGRLVTDGTPEALAARAPGHGTVVMIVRGEVLERIGRALAAMPGVAEVEAERHGPGRARLVARPRPGQVIAADIAALIRRSRWPVESFDVERGRLREVFRELARPSEAA